jgi:signal transduction histidine kinase
METGAPIGTDDFRLLNACLDDAMAGAVTQYGRERHQSTIDGESARENERLGFLAHELRNLIHTALIAFEVIKSGNVGVGGSTGTVLKRSLLGARDLIGRSLAEVRLTQGVQNRKPFLVTEMIEELAPSATLLADATGITLTVLPVDSAVAIDADRQVLAAAVTNLLQNAFKFTGPRTTVTLRVRASDERVSIEVEDECGGLADGNGKDLFRPFEQRSTDRTGLGLGLAFSRWAAEANGGRIATRNLPGHGCVFAVDLPRCPVPALAMV